MKVKDLLKKTLPLLGKDEMLKTNTFDKTSETVLTEEQNLELDKIVKCMNFVYKEITSSYLPLFEVEKVSFVNQELDLTTLNKTVLEVYSVKLLDGFKPTFKTYYDHITLSTSNFMLGVSTGTFPAIIKYSYLPDDAELEGDIILPKRLLAEVFAYGISREFYLLNGDTYESDIFENKFKNGIQAAMCKNASVYLPARRWL